MAAKFDLEIKSDWLLICFHFVTKSPSLVEPRNKLSYTLKADFASIC